MEHRRSQRAQQRPWQEETWEEERVVREVPSFDEDEEPVEEIIATNRMVLLTCTLAAMCSPFALFLLYAEKKSRAIRHFAVQSVALTAVHLLLGAVLLIAGLVLGGIPYFGFLLHLSGWIIYIAAVILMLVMRIRMMNFAWQGVKFVLPVIGSSIERFC